MVGAHTDSPVLRIKPVSNKREAGYVQIGVETYGGGIWHSCESCRQSVLCMVLLVLMMLGFDRDLGVAGRAMVRTGDGSIVQKLLKIDRPSMPLSI